MSYMFLTPRRQILNFEPLNSHKYLTIFQEKSIISKNQKSKILHGNKSFFQLKSN